MHIENQEQALDLLRSSAEGMGVDFFMVGSQDTVPDDIYFGQAKAFFDALQRIYEQNWMSKWMPNPVERAFFCVKVMNCWITCVKHAGIFDINYLLTETGDSLLRQLMENLLCDFPVESYKEWDLLLGQQITKEITEV